MVTVENVQNDINMKNTTELFKCISQKVIVKNLAIKKLKTSLVNYNSFNNSEKIKKIK